MSIRQVYLILLILAVVNISNYIDRQIIFAVFPFIKSDLLLSDKQLGFISSVFIIVYLSISPVFGRLGDILTRKWIIALGVGLGSLATAGMSIAKSYSQLLLIRSSVAIGEASYTVIAPLYLIFSERKTEERPFPFLKSRFPWEARSVTYSEAS